MKQKGTLLLYKNWLKAWLKLPDDIYMDLTQGLFKYAIGEEPEFKTQIGAALFEQYRDSLDEDQLKYDQICAARSEAGRRGARKRWNQGPEEMANDSKDSKSHFCHDGKMAKIAHTDTDTQYHTDTDTESHTDTESDTQSQSDATFASDDGSVNFWEPPDCQRIVDDFNKTCKSLTQVSHLTAMRERAIAQMTVKGYTYETFHQLFEKCEDSDFLSGRSGSWRASFDWLMKEENAAKVLENQYTNRNKGIEDSVFARAARGEQV